MTTVLHYGDRRAVELDLPPGALRAQFVAPAGPEVPDPAAAAAAALGDPIGFPPLAQATVPGDRVAVALAAGMPCRAAIVAGIVTGLLDCGVLAQAISIVEPPVDARSTRSDPRGHLPPAVAARIQWVVHDPTDRRQLSYLAASAKGRAIYLNRTLCDADLILPVTCLRPRRTPGFHGAYAGLFPIFSDRHTIEQLRTPRSTATSDQQRQPEVEADEVAWLLGVSVTVGVVPGADGRVLQILAGDAAAVFQQAQWLCDTAWRFSVPGRARLVVTGIGGGPGQQTWANVARALAAAARVMSDQGTVVVCTDLNVRPGPVLGSLGSHGDREQAIRAIRRDRSPDARVAMALVRAAARGPVYLLSRLDDEVVEGLGIAPVANADEIGRLARQHESCILLGNAQHVVPTVLAKHGVEAT